MKTIRIITIKQWRAWLQKNHTQEKRVGIILYKRHTGKPAPTHRELIEEAICFGWIDTTIKRRDKNTYIRTFTRRNKNSKWSENTLSYAKKLLQEEKMKPEGIKFYKSGLQKPTHDEDIPKNPNMPHQLKITIAKNRIAQKNFDNFSPSTKRMLYRWILSGKLPQTRTKRIKDIVKLARENKRPF